jgi:NADH-quinone oxidoreductase subunit J
MLLNVKREDRYHAQLPVAALLGLTFLTTVLLAAVRVRDASAPTETADGPAGASGNTETIGQALYSTYLFPFEVASLILLVAMIGAIVLAKKDVVPVKGDQ